MTMRTCHGLQLQSISGRRDGRDRAWDRDETYQNIQPHVQDLLRVEVAYDQYSICSSLDEALKERVST